MSDRPNRQTDSAPVGSPAQAHDAQPDLAELRAAFPDWNIWASDEGHWYATHRAALHPHAALFGLWPMVDGANLAVLHAELTLQVVRAAAALTMIDDCA